MEWDALVADKIVARPSVEQGELILRLRAHILSFCARVV
jgi:hypothetical protein